jgi:hypothetical protein
LDPHQQPRIYVLLRAWYGTASTSGQATYARKRLGMDHVFSSSWCKSSVGGLICR